MLQLLLIFVVELGLQIFGFTTDANILSAIPFPPLFSGQYILCMYKKGYIACNIFLICKEYLMNLFFHTSI